jgi:hypothetical protein
MKCLNTGWARSSACILVKRKACAPLRTRLAALAQPAAFSPAADKSASCFSRIIVGSHFAILLTLRYAAFPALEGFESSTRAKRCGFHASCSQVIGTPYSRDYVAIPT